MQQYKVLATSITSSENNKTYQQGDEVNEFCFPPGHITQLVADKAVSLIIQEFTPPAAEEKEIPKEKSLTKVNAEDIL